LLADIFGSLVGLAGICQLVAHKLSDNVNVLGRLLPEGFWRIVNLQSISNGDRKHTLIERTESSFLAVIEAYAKLNLRNGAATKVETSCGRVNSCGRGGSLRFSSGDGDGTVNWGGASISSDSNRDFSLGDSLK